MGLYLRKSFRAGPIRFNLSKSGIGLSGGVKGARIGVGPRGRYVHAGRHGFYYRKSLSAKSKSRKKSSIETGAAQNSNALLWLVGIIAGIMLLYFLLTNLFILVILIIVALSLFSVRYFLGLKRESHLKEYINLLKNSFLESELPPDETILTQIKFTRSQLSKNDKMRKSVNDIEADIYIKLLSKVVSDKHISVNESAIVNVAETTLAIESKTKIEAKKEIFLKAYLEAIEDHKISKKELVSLESFINGLNIPRKVIHKEISVIKQLVKAQNLALPFDVIEDDGFSMLLQKSENLHYQGNAQLLSRRKSKTSLSGYEYTIKRDGKILITDKSTIVFDDGTTKVRHVEIDEIDVDIDEGIIELSKKTSGRPVIIKTDTPIVVGRMIELLSKTA